MVLLVPQPKKDYAHVLHSEGQGSKCRARHTGITQRVESETLGGRGGGAGKRVHALEA